MPENLNAQIEAARRKLTEQEELKRKLPVLRDNITKGAHRLRMLEYQLEQATDNVKTLESLTLASLMESLIGRKERKLAEQREEAAKLKQEFDECVEVVVGLDEEVETIEQQLEELGNVDETYQTLCEKNQRPIMEEGDDAADRLGGLTEEFSRARDEHRRVKAAIQTGEHLLERLHSMTRAAGRARNKSLSVLGVGVIAAVTTNAVTRQSARGSVNRAGEGFTRFGQILSELDLSSGTPADNELARLGPAICVSCGELSLRGAIHDSGAAAPFLDTVQEAIGHLREKSKEIQQRIREIDEERHTLIESA